MSQGDLARDGQAESYAPLISAAGAVGARELLEDSFPVRLRDTLTIVDDDQLDVSAVIIDLDPYTMGRVLLGVVQQTGEDADDLEGYGPDDDTGHQLQLGRMAIRPAQDFAADQVGQVEVLEFLHPVRLHACQGEQIVHDRLQTVDAFERPGDKLVEVGLLGMHESFLKFHAQSGHWRPELV